MRFKHITSLFLCLLAICILVACTKEPEKVEDIYYTVTFNTNGGTSMNSQSVKSGEKAQRPTNPTKATYVFINWYDNEALTGVAYSFDHSVTANMTLYAKWDLEVLPVTKHVVTFDFDNSLSPALIEVLNNTKVQKPTDPIKEGFDFTGWFLGEALFDFDTLVTADLTLKAHWEEIPPTSDVISISTKEALIDLFTKGGDKAYQLTADIDFEGTDMEGSKADFSGVLDGNGYTISNLHAKGTANKQGAFFKRIINGTVKNLKIVNSSMTAGGNGEGTAFIAYAAHGTATFDHIEFTNVKMIGIGSYTALIFADNADDTNTDAEKILNRITVINNSDHAISGKNYTGGLIGHVRTVGKITLSNIYFDSKVSSKNGEAFDQVAGSLIGRIQGSNSVITVGQAVIKGSIEASKNVGAIIGTSETSTLTVSNVWIERFNALVSEGNKVNTLVGNLNGMTILDTNVFFNQQTTNLTAVDKPLTPTQGTSVATSDLSTWFETSGLSNAYFKLENQMVVLNRASAPKNAEGISILSNSIKTKYHVGETLDLSTIIIKLNYSDASSETLSDGYVMDDTQINLNHSGVYELSVSYDSFVAKISITVVEAVGFDVHTIDFNHVFLLDSTSINLDGIALTAILSDQSIMNVLEGEYQIDKTQVDLTTEGAYQLAVTYRNFTQQYINVFVSAPITEETLTVFVNPSTEITDHGILRGDNIVYPTIGAAINYLSRLNLAADVKKVITIADGTYHEKLTVSIPNLTIMGQSKDGVILTYDAAAGSRMPTGGTWGTQGSATLSIKSQAKNFAIARMTIKNSFDYFNSNLGDKQAVAIVNEADKAIFTQLNITGVQDTLYAKQGRQWYLNNYIEGAVDYIFGNGGPAFFEQNTIHTIYRANADGVITAQKGENNTGKPLAYGYVFYQNELTTNNTARPVWFGRPWGAIAKVMFIENNLQDGIMTGWTDMSGNKPENAFFYEHKNTLNYVLMENTTHGKSLTDSQALNAIDKTYVFAKDNGSDTFDDAWDFNAHMAYVNMLLEGPR